MRTLPPCVHELLDRGVDPLTDHRTAQWLHAHPETLEAFAALRTALIEIQAMPTSRPRTSPWSRPLPWLAVAAAAAAAALLAFALRGDVTTDSGALPRPQFATAGGVVSCRVATTERAGTRGRQSVVLFAGARSGNRSGARSTLARRDSRSLQTFSNLAGPVASAIGTPWSRARITEVRVLRP